MALKSHQLPNSWLERPKSHSIILILVSHFFHEVVEEHKLEAKEINQDHLDNARLIKRQIADIGRFSN